MWGTRDRGESDGGGTRYAGVHICEQQSSLKYRPTPKHIFMVMQKSSWTRILRNFALNLTLLINTNQISPETISKHTVPGDCAIAQHHGVLLLTLA